MYALIKNNLVEQVIVADAEFAASIESQWDAVVAASEPCGVGYTYSNGVFTAPPPPVIAPVPRHISVGAFFDRFGAQKYPILASTDAGVKALITDCSVRKYIDLDNPALPYGLAMLVSAGYAVDADAIVNAEIAAGERA